MHSYWACLNPRQGSRISCWFWICGSNKVGVQKINKVIFTASLSSLKSYFSSKSSKAFSIKRLHMLQVFGLDISHLYILDPKVVVFNIPIELQPHYQHKYVFAKCALVPSKSNSNTSFTSHSTVLNPMS